MTLCLHTTVFDLNLDLVVIAKLADAEDIVDVLGRAFQIPTLTLSSNESKLIPNMSGYVPYLRIQFTLIKLPLLTMLTLSTFRSCLQ